MGPSPYLVKKLQICNSHPWSRRPGRAIIPSGDPQSNYRSYVVQTLTTSKAKKFSLILIKEKSMRTYEAVGPPEGPEHPFPIHLSGPIIKGFGRGSKEVSEWVTKIPSPCAYACIRISPPLFWFRVSFI